MILGKSNQTYTLGVQLALEDKKRREAGLPSCVDWRPTLRDRAVFAVDWLVNRLLDFRAWLVKPARRRSPCGGVKLVTLAR